MNDCALIEAVRSRSEIYYKSHAGFKNPAIKEAAWKAISEAIGGTQTECICRWNVLRDRFSKENRLTELQTRSGAAATGKPAWIHFKSMSFLKTHIRKRKSVCNLPRRTPAAVNSILEVEHQSPLTPPTPSTSTDDDDTSWVQLNKLLPDQVQESSKEEQKDKEYTVLALYSETPSTSSSAAASLPYLGPTGRCKKPKLEEDTTTLFKKVLTGMNKSLTSSETDPCNDPDNLIGRSVSLALKSLKTTSLKLQFRKKFRCLVQECEEAELMDE